MLVLFVNSRSPWYVLRTTPSLYRRMYYEGIAYYVGAQTPQKALGEPRQG